MTKKYLPERKRIALVTNDHKIACDRSTDGFLLTSPLMSEHYETILPDYTNYIKRKI